MIEVPSSWSRPTDRSSLAAFRHVTEFFALRLDVLLFDVAVVFDLGRCVAALIGYRISAGWHADVGQLE